MLLLAVFLLLITYLTIRWIQLKQYWAKRGVAHIPPHPVLGSLTFLYRENPAPWFLRLYKRFKEPYVGIWIFWRPAIVINSDKIARNILIRDQTNFRNRFASSGTTDPVGSLNLFSVNDPLWSLLRKRLTILFTSSKLRGIQNNLIVKSKELIERINKDRLKPEPINLKAIMIDFSTDITSLSSFGIESDAILTGESYFRTITQGYSEYQLLRSLSWISIFFIPEFVDFFRFKMFPVESTEYLRKILREIIAQRGGLENIVTEPRDLLDILIKIQQEGDKEFDMTENMMLAQAAAFVIGGFETTSTTLTFAIYELAFNPEVQDKLYKELKEAQDKHGDILLDFGLVSELTYLNRVVDETLRKYPLLTWLDRIALKDYKVDDHLTIKAGTPVFVNVMGLHHDPDFYPEPEKFNPDRIFDHDKDIAKPFSYMPFGEGPRKCIGQRLGLSTVRYGICTIILNYEVRPLPNAPKPAEVTLFKNTMFLTVDEKLSVEFVPRN